MDLETEALGWHNQPKNTARSLIELGVGMCSLAAALVILHTEVLL